jgi:hypothetical protein
VRWRLNDRRENDDVEFVGFNLQPHARSSVTGDVVPARWLVGPLRPSNAAPASPYRVLEPIAFSYARLISAVTISCLYNRLKTFWAWGRARTSKS